MGVAVVTGATGQDGVYLVRALAARGDRVVGIARGASAQAHSNLELVRGDVEDSAFVARVISDAKPTEIYHLAGQTSVGVSLAEPAATFRSVALGTLNVLEAARSAKQPPRVFLASSAEVFGDLGEGLAREDTPFRPLSPYGAAKAAASELARTYRTSYGLHVCIAFLYNHESPLRAPNFVTRKIVRAACRIARGVGSPLELGDTSVVRDWGWAPEYVDAATRMLARDTPDDYVIATGTSCSLEEFVHHVFSVLGLKAAEHVTRSPALLRRAEIPAMRADPSRAAERLGWRASHKAKEVARLLVEAELRELDGY